MKKAAGHKKVPARRAVVVGAGFFGATVAERLANSLGWKVLLLEKRRHLGGNSFSEPDKATGIEIHRYGSHIFHTRHTEVWSYVNKFSSFNAYRHVVWARAGRGIYPLPFSLATLSQFWNRALTPDSARKLIEKEISKEKINTPRNLEEKAISAFGRTLYEAFIEEYTRKHWGADPTELPADIITRLSIRYDYSMGYFDDPWQGIPVEGYGTLFKKMLDSDLIEVLTGTDYFDVRGDLPPHDLLVYTGPIDRFFEYRHGKLGWRSVRFEEEIMDVPDFQGAAVVNYCGRTPSYTRIHEYKHYAVPPSGGGKTVIHREYSCGTGKVADPAYPVRSDADMAVFRKYDRLAKDLRPKVIFGGRLASYRYCNMDQAIAAALACVSTIGKQENNMTRQQD